MALAVRSAILGGISSPVLTGDYWIGFLFQAAFGVVVCLALYGIEITLLKGVKRKSTPFALASVRAAVLLFVLSLLKFGDLPRALGSLLAGLIYGAILFAVELGGRKLLRLVGRKNA